MKTKLSPIGIAGIILFLTYAIPTTLWLVNNFSLSSKYSEFVAALLVIIGALVWYTRTQAVPLLPSSLAWKVFCVIGCVITLILFFINIYNEPVSQITGQARPPLSVFSVIILLPLAEELIFRGVMWSFIERSSTKYRWEMLPLLGTSLLFGLAHLGYWIQSHWLLPPDAFLHSLSMVAAGLFFGVIRWTSGTLFAPIVIHMTANSTILLFQ
ncbi:CPBP family intramembrane glutamic endopeptidase [Thiomicrorhabdus sp.]|uniref:CPBP family intramembrane glutamic endopeptidase n=1 Tax=Thiomicrorhabdus sp. TaxID=2039724 RepID=UPI003747E6DA